MSLFVKLPVSDSFRIETSLKKTKTVKKIKRTKSLAKLMTISKKKPQNIFVLRRDQLIQSKQLLMKTELTKLINRTEFELNSKKNQIDILSNIKRNFENLNLKIQKQENQALSKSQANAKKLNEINLETKQMQSHLPSYQNKNMKDFDLGNIVKGKAIDSNQKGNNIFYSERKNRREKYSEIQEIHFQNGAIFRGKVFKMKELMKNKQITGVGSLQTFDNVIYKGTFQNNELVRGKIHYFDTFKITVRSKASKKNFTVFDLYFKFAKNLKIHCQFKNYYQMQPASPGTFKMTDFKYNFTDIKAKQFSKSKKHMCFYQLKDSFGLLFRKMPFYIYLGDTESMKPDGKGIKIFASGGYMDGFFKRGIGSGNCKIYEAYTGVYTEGKLYNKLRVGLWRKFDRV